MLEYGCVIMTSGEDNIIKYKNELKVIYSINKRAWLWFHLLLYICFSNHEIFNKDYPTGQFVYSY